MKKKTLIGFVLGLLFFSMQLATLVSANLIIDPAKLGILRLQLYPFSPAVAIREFRVGNTYDVPMDIELELLDDMQNLTTLSETKFTLQPGENRTVEYTVTVNEPGYYTGAILVKANIDKGTFGYKADLAIFVNESNLDPYFYIAIALVIALIVIASLVFLMKKMKHQRREAGKRKWERVRKNEIE